MKLNILNYKHVLAIAFMGLAVCISSCKDDEEGITGFRLDKESIELPDTVRKVINPSRCVYIYDESALTTQTALPSPLAGVIIYQSASEEAVNRSLVEI